MQQKRVRLMSALREFYFVLFESCWAAILRLSFIDSVYLKLEKEKK